MADGRIIKALSGFYYVLDNDVVYQCRGRGNFRKRKITPLVGDFVEYEAENLTDGYILDVKERKNELIRPPISNVDQAVLIFSILEPDFSPLLLDRFLVRVESKYIKPIICLTKLDLVSDLDKVKPYIRYYQNIGYQVITTSIETKEGLDELKQHFKGAVTVFAGQSGVGKSSLLNAIRPDLSLETGEISTHLGRGKHTTRHVELIHIANGLVADTPGFSSLEFTEIEPENLTLYFPEMNVRKHGCKFRGCTHISEPKCAIKEALENNEISQQRYKHYQVFLEELKEQQARRY
jgi:ribosome biogenesis GTPase / thiamine phosphate phosphatase